MRYSKGQVSETTTWLVATVIIIFALLMSVYAASTISVLTKNVGVGSSSEFFKGQNEGDVFLKESIFAYMITKDTDGINIYTQMTSDGSTSSFGQSFGLSVFGKIYDLSKISLVKINFNGKSQVVISSDDLVNGALTSENVKIKAHSFEVIGSEK